MSAATATFSKKQIKAVALPAEHGGWGFVLEPIILGLLIAPSWAGLLLGISAFAAFLTRQPLKMTLIDWRRGKRFARTRLAERFILIYGLIALLGLMGALLLAGTIFLPPLLIAVPFGLIQIGFDARGESRHWLPEISGSTGIAAISAAILLAGGIELLPALAIWVVLVARTIPSILYVRARLRLERGQQPNIALPIVSHIIAAVLVTGLIAVDLLPGLAALAMVILLLRAAHGLSDYRRPSPAKVIGFQEIGFGVMLVLLVAVGYWLI